jgi:ribosomal protein L44E
MAYQDDNRPQRQMIDITDLNITCAECGKAITELPFKPTKRDDDTYGKLYCFDCNKKRRMDRGPRRNFGSRY